MVKFPWFCWPTEGWSCTVSRETSTKGTGKTKGGRSSDASWGMTGVFWGNDPWEIHGKSMGNPVILGIYGEVGNMIGYICYTPINIHESLIFLEELFCRPYGSKDFLRRYKTSQIIGHFLKRYGWIHRVVTPYRGKKNKVNLHQFNGDWLVLSS